ncbi:MAG TPA: helix-turn-helix transcriptional regulator [Vicinamibacteria bacterium]|jgi:DNA-binding PadR family transcriptional regulator
MDISTVERFLPLRPVVFAILLLLRGDDLHGYALMKRVNERIGRRAILGPGTLYRTLKEMRELGLLKYAPQARRTATDERRTYYRLTALGREVVDAEAERLASLMREARLLEARPRRA